MDSFFRSQAEQASAIPAAAAVPTVLPKDVWGDEAQEEKPSVEVPPIAVDETQAPGNAMSEERRKDFDAVFNSGDEPEKKHTLLKIIMFLLILLILLEAVVIGLKMFAPDSAASMKIQEIYNTIFSRFIGG